MVENFERFIGKMVRSKRGIPIGVIKESVKDDVSGEVTSLLVDPTKDINIKDFDLTDQGKIVLPCQDIFPVKDALIFEEELGF